VYKIQIQSSSFRLCPPCNRYTSIKTLKHYVSEDGSASVFRQEAPNLLDPLDRALLSRWVPLNRHVLWEGAKILETETNQAYSTYKDAAYMACLQITSNRPRVEISSLRHHLFGNELSYSWLIC